MPLVEKWVCCLPDRIPSDVYELLSLRRDRRGLTLVFEGTQKTVVAEFGFLPISVRRGRELRLDPESLPKMESQEQICRENGLLYQVENGAKLCRFRSEATSAEEAAQMIQLIFLAAGDPIEVIAWGLPAVTVLPRQSKAAVQESLPTPLGPVQIFADGQAIPYRCTALPLQGRRFRVEGRWRLDCLLPDTTAPVEVVCRIAVNETRLVTAWPETGEALALMSFRWGDSKLSIGTEGDLPGVSYCYEKNGMRLRFLNGPVWISLYLAWLTMTEPDREEIYPWFAADPSSDETRGQH